MAPAGPTDPDRDAEVWHARIAGSLRSSMPHEVDRPARPQASLASFVERVLESGEELVILVAGDDALPQLAGALDLAIRPLCLVLPQAEFAAGLALRATISLLRSRLWRDGDDSRSGAWQAQRERLDRAPALWRQAQGSLARDDGAGPSVALCDLFPALIVPLAVWPRLPPRPRAIFVFFGCDAPGNLEIDAGRQLRIDLGGPTNGSGKLTAAEQTTPLLLERSRLSLDIADLELELANVQTELGEFMAEYYRRVGGLMAEHDALQAELAARRSREVPGNAELHRFADASARQARESAEDIRRRAEVPPADAIPFNPDRESKKLFRRLAQQIHPDRAIDEEDRAWRTQLMSEANRAYRHGDCGALREIAELWDEQPGTRRSGRSAGVAQLELQLQRLRARLARIEGELHRLFGSQLYELFIASRQARRQGRDLLEEMAERIAANIEELRRQDAAAPSS